MSELMEVITSARRAFARDTSELPDQWSPDRPSTGHCAVLSMIVQQYFGGQIVRGTTADGIVHYWNVVDGVTVDGTRDQFAADVSFPTVEIHFDRRIMAHSEALAKKSLLLRRMGRHG
jgi:hypothetical protein